MCGGTISATFDPGYKVADLTPLTSSSCTVQIRNLPADTTPDDISRHVELALEHFIEPRFIHIWEEDSSLATSLRFPSIGEGKKAVEAFSESLMEGEQLDVSLVETAPDVLCRSRLSFSWLLSEPVDGDKAPGCPDELLPGGTDTDPEGPPFIYCMPLEYVLRNIKDLLETGHNSPVEFDLVTRPEENYQRAIATFIDPAIAEYVFNDLKDANYAFLGGQSLDPQIQHTMIIHINHTMCGTLSPHIEAVLLNCNSPTLSWHNHEDQSSGCVILTLASPELAPLATARSSILTLLRGKPLCHLSGLRLWDPILTEAPALPALQEVAKYYDLHISLSPRTQTVLLHGPASAQSSATPDLLAVFHNLAEHLLHRFVFPTPHPSSRAGFLLALRQNFGDHRIISTNAHTLTLRLLPDEIPTATHILTTPSPNISDCIICASSAEIPILTPCGHVYCTSCFANSAAHKHTTRTLPFRCDGGSCNRPLPIGFLERHIPPRLIDALEQVAVRRYIDNHREEMFVCPTASCTSIFGTLPGNKGLLGCRQCFALICKRCETPAHQPVSCSQNAGTEERRFAGWRKTHGWMVRKCPGQGCGAWIEKSAGCEHIVCAKCKVDFCWRCGEVQEAVGVCQHLRGCRRGKMVRLPQDPVLREYARLRRQERLQRARENVRNSQE